MTPMPPTDPRAQREPLTWRSGVRHAVSGIRAAIEDPTPKTQSEPLTEAGRWAATVLRAEGTAIIGPGSVEDAIAAIEREAASRSETAGLRESTPREHLGPRPW